MKLEEDMELTQLRMRRIAELMKKDQNDDTSPDRPIILTDNSFDEFAKSNRFAVIDFWASWCGPCRMMAPILDRLASEYKGKIAFGKLNVDENPSTSSQFGIMSIPTLLVLNNGQVIDRIVGAHPAQALKTKLEAHLTKYS